MALVMALCVLVTPQMAQAADYTLSSWGNGTWVVNSSNVLASYIFSASGQAGTAASGSISMRELAKSGYKGTYGVDDASGKQNRDGATSTSGVQAAQMINSLYRYHYIEAYDNNANVSNEGGTIGLSTAVAGSGLYSLGWNTTNLLRRGISQLNVVNVFDMPTEDNGGNNLTQGLDTSGMHGDQDTGLFGNQIATLFRNAGIDRTFLQAIFGLSFVVVSFIFVIVLMRGISNYKHGNALESSKHWGLRILTMALATPLTVVFTSMLVTIGSGLYTNSTEQLADLTNSIIIDSKAFVGNTNANLNIIGTPSGSSDNQAANYTNDSYQPTEDNVKRLNDDIMSMNTNGYPSRESAGNGDTTIADKLNGYVSGETFTVQDYFGWITASGQDIAAYSLHGSQNDWHIPSIHAGNGKNWYNLETTSNEYTDTGSVYALNAVTDAREMVTQQAPAQTPNATTGSAVTEVKATSGSDKVEISGTIIKVKDFDASFAVSATSGEQTSGNYKLTTTVTGNSGTWSLKQGDADVASGTYNVSVATTAASRGTTSATIRTAADGTQYDTASNLVADGADPQSAGENHPTEYRIEGFTDGTPGYATYYQAQPKIRMTDVQINQPETYVYTAVTAKGYSPQEATYYSYVFAGNKQPNSMLTTPWGEDVDAEQPSRVFAANQMRRAWINAEAGIQARGNGNSFSTQSVAFLLQSKYDYTTSTLNYKAYASPSNTTSANVNSGANSYKYARYVIPRIDNADYAGKVLTLNVSWLTAGWASLIGLIALVTGPFLGAMFKGYSGWFKAQFTGDVFGLFDYFFYFLALYASFYMFALAVQMGVLVMGFLGNVVSVIPDMSGVASDVQSGLHNVPFIGDGAGNLIGGAVMVIYNILVSAIVVVLLSWPIISLNVGGTQRRCSIVSAMVMIPYAIASMASAALGRYHDMFYGGGHGGQGIAAPISASEHKRHLGSVATGAAVGAVGAGAAIYGAKTLGTIGADGIRAGVAAGQNAYEDGVGLGGSLAHGIANGAVAAKDVAAQTLPAYVAATGAALAGAKDFHGGVKDFIPAVARQLGGIRSKTLSARDELMKQHGTDEYVTTTPPEMPNARGLAEDDGVDGISAASPTRDSVTTPDAMTDENSTKFQVIPGDADYAGDNEAVSTEIANEQLPDPDETGDVTEAETEAPKFVVHEGGAGTDMSEDAATEVIDKDANPVADEIAQRRSDAVQYRSADDLTSRSLADVESDESEHAKRKATTRRDAVGQVKRDGVIKSVAAFVAPKTAKRVADATSAVRAQVKTRSAARKVSELHHEQLIAEAKERSGNNVLSQTELDRIGSVVRRERKALVRENIDAIHNYTDQTSTLKRLSEQRAARKDKLNRSGGRGMDAIAERQRRKQARRNQG